MLIDINKVVIKKRVRVELGDIESLMDSLKNHGLFHPIIVNRNYELISGFRRLESAKRLGWLEIDAKIVDAVSRQDLLERELEENLLRKPFTDVELHEGYLRLNRLQNPSLIMRIIIKIKSFFKKLLAKKS